MTIALNSLLGKLLISILLGFFFSPLRSYLIPSLGISNFLEELSSLSHSMLGGLKYQTCMQVSCETCIYLKKQQLEPDMKQQTGSK